MKSMPKDISAYFSALGRKGGTKSRRSLSSEAARNMVRVRDARRIFRKYHAQCFWYMRPDLDVNLEDIPDLVRGLRKNGGRQGFFIAAKLCR
ncbi:MAG: hypothetical protein PHG71_03115 [Kiritimatiellae bacterium]|nr:hypothetical protein [Kiritimatiellia bacterium]